MSAIFDGSATYLSRSSGLTGVSDSKKGTIAFWFKRGATGAGSIFSSGSATGFYALFTSGNLLRFIGYNSAGTKILQLDSSAITSTSLWYHAIASWDLSAGSTHLYINGSSDNTEDTATDAAVDYTGDAVAIGGSTAGASLYNGKLYDLIFWPGSYADLSDATELRKFVSSDGVAIAAADPYGAGQHIATIPSGVKPVGYGHDASFPTGVRPAVFFSNDWRINRGTGGPFTLVSDFDTESSPDIPNAYRLASRGGKVGERWFDSEKSGMSAPRSETFIERRPGHPDYGKRLRTKDEMDERTRDLEPRDRSFISLLNPREDDSVDGPR